jgi:hypothetical protein
VVDPRAQGSISLVHPDPHDDHTRPVFGGAHPYNV